MSHPSRGGWIEISIKTSVFTGALSPTPHGVGGLKYEAYADTIQKASPTPHGVGGLKYQYLRRPAQTRRSHPSRGGWIEIGLPLTALTVVRVSHPSRGGWIEIILFAVIILSASVPPLTGWVD